MFPPHASQLVFCSALCCLLASFFLHTHFPGNIWAHCCLLLTFLLSSLVPNSPEQLWPCLFPFHQQHSKKKKTMAIANRQLKGAISYFQFLWLWTPPKSLFSPPSPFAIPLALKKMRYVITEDATIRHWAHCKGAIQGLFVPSKNISSSQVHQTEQCEMHR